MKLVYASIYVPNDPGAQQRFYLQFNNTVQKFSSESIILGDDSNCPLSKEDKEVAQPRGPSFWKFNSTLLQEWLEDKYSTVYWQSLLEDQGLPWEMV